MTGPTLMLVRNPADVDNGYPESFAVLYDGQPVMANTRDPSRAVKVLARQVEDCQRRRVVPVIQVWTGENPATVADVATAVLALHVPVTL